VQDKNNMQNETRVDFTDRDLLNEVKDFILILNGLQLGRTHQSPGGREPKSIPLPPVTNLETLSV
jgi:hypothetical protein